MLRIHLLDKYKVGTIASDKSDLRIAFSGLEEENLEEMVELIARAAEDWLKSSIKCRARFALPDLRH